jgi:hypothetical protein
MEKIQTNSDAGEKPVVAASLPPPKNKGQKRSFPNRSGSTERNVAGLTKVFKPSTTTMGINQTQFEVLTDLARLPECVDLVSNAFMKCLRTNEEQNDFRLCHLIATAYDLWLLVDIQSSNQFGLGPTVSGRTMLRLHDLSASFVEACSATSLQDGIKLSTHGDGIISQIKTMINRSYAKYHGTRPERQFNDDELTLAEFPLTDILSEWEVLLSKATRMSGSLGSWRIPDPKSDFSLLAHGVVNYGERYMCVGPTPLPQRLEKVCVVLGLIFYEELGPASFLPQVTCDVDRKSAAVRAGVVSGTVMPRRMALLELLTGAAPISKV